MPDPPQLLGLGQRPPQYRAVLVAGDASIQAFDNAIDRLAEGLAARGALVPGTMRRLSARPPAQRGEGIGLATPENMLDAIATLRPAPGQACLIYATAHGAPERGLYFPANPRSIFLSPERLDRALEQGCGTAPALVVLSGCYAGFYLRPPLIRPNRIILTAARRDRPSFGCGAENTYTEFDECMITAMEGTRGTLNEAFATAATCVSGRERLLGAPPSEPQAWFGAAVTYLALPGQPP